MSWFTDVIEWMSSLFESHASEDVTFDFDEDDDIESIVEDVVTSLDTGDVTTTADGAIDELNALAAELGVDLSTASEPDWAALIELFWDGKESQIATPLSDLAHDLGVDIETLSSQDAIALHELWNETQDIEMVDDAQKSDFVAFLEANFPDLDPLALDDALDLFQDKDEEGGIEIAAVFSTLGEAVAYCEGVPESILKIAPFSNYFIVIRDYKE